jgi:hypothetical protein
MFDCNYRARLGRRPSAFANASAYATPAGRGTAARALARRTSGVTTGRVRSREVAAQPRPVRSGLARFGPVRWLIAGTNGQPPECDPGSCISGVNTQIPEKRLFAGFSRRLDPRLGRPFHRYAGWAGSRMGCKARCHIKQRRRARALAAVSRLVITRADQVSPQTAGSRTRPHGCAGQSRPRWQPQPAGRTGGLGASVDPRWTCRAALFGKAIWLNRVVGGSQPLTEVAAPATWAGRTTARTRRTVSCMRLEGGSTSKLRRADRARMTPPGALRIGIALAGRCSAVGPWRRRRKVISS